MPFDGLPPGGGTEWRLLFNIEAPGSCRTMPVVLADVDLLLVAAPSELAMTPDPEEEQPGHTVLRWCGSALLDLKLGDEAACRRLHDQIRGVVVNAPLTVKLAAIKPDLTESQTFLVTGRVVHAVVLPVRHDVAPMDWKVIIELVGRADER